MSENEGQNDTRDEKSLNDGVNDRICEIKKNVSLSSLRWQDYRSILTLENNLASLAALTNRVNGGSNLSTRSQPEEEGRVESIKEGNDGGNSEEHQQQVTSQKVGRIETHFNDLDNVFSGGLTQDMTA